MLTLLDIARQGRGCEAVQRFDAILERTLAAGVATFSKGREDRTAIRGIVAPFSQLRQGRQTRPHMLSIGILNVTPRSILKFTLVRSDVRGHGSQSMQEVREDRGVKSVREKVALLGLTVHKIGCKVAALPAVSDAGTHAGLYRSSATSTVQYAF